jgi:hypothetical protein
VPAPAKLHVPPIQPIHRIGDNPKLTQFRVVGLSPSFLLVCKQKMEQSGKRHDQQTQNNAYDSHFSSGRIHNPAGNRFRPRTSQRRLAM